MNNLDSKSRIIIGSQLQKARELLQLTLEEVAQELNVSFNDIINWEKEKTRPILKQLEKLAELYGREIDYFLKETPAPPERIEFRGKPGQSLKELSRDIKIILARFDELCRTSIEFEDLLNKRLKVELPRFKSSDQPKTVAKGLRDIFNIEEKPLLDLRNLLEEKGIRIFELPIPENAFSGFSFWHSEYGPSVLLNAKDTKGRRNFTLAHEVAHLIYDHGSSLCYIPLIFDKYAADLEYKANQVAIELLLPDLELEKDFSKRNLSKTPTEKELAQMASKWGVSVQALGYRLENLDLIERELTNKIVETRPKHPRRPKAPIWQRQLGNRFVEISIEAYKKNFISSGRLAHALQIPIRKAIEIVEQRSK